MKGVQVLSHTLRQLQEYPAKRYLIGFSGGRDSHVLLDVLVRLCEQGKLHTPVTVIHVNHNLNPKADEWTIHCQSVCDDYGIPCIVETVTDTPKSSESIEAFARNARYQLIEKHLHEGDIFLSAHHQRDQAETFLLQLMRGAGLDGLRAMPVIRDLGLGRYLRPLLSVDYDEIVQYASEHNLNFINDDSNDDVRFDRNFLRHQIIPLLEQRFPRAVQNISQSAQWLSEVPEQKVPQSLLIRGLNALEQVEQKQQIRAFVKNKVGISLSRNQINYILANHLTAGADKHPVLSLGDYVLRRYAGELIITNELPEGQSDEQNDAVFVQVGQGAIISPVASLQWQRGEGLEIDDVLHIKALRGSERFHPHTRSCATTVKKYLNESNVPVWLRPFYVGLYLDNQLVAIPGCAVSKEYYKKSEKAQLPLWIIDSKFAKI